MNFQYDRRVSAGLEDTAPGWKLVLDPDHATGRNQVTVAVVIRNRGQAEAAIRRRVTGPGILAPMTAAEVRKSALLPGQVGRLSS